MTRVLVIDDDPPMRLLCRINLEAEGMEVLDAPDGGTGLELARSARPDAVLLDLMLAGVDGWEVAARLLDDPRTSAIPIVFLTARAELGEAGQGAGLHCVTKPFDPVGLAALVERALGPVGDVELRRGRLAELRALVDG